MTTRPYELLARFAPDGTVAGVSIRTITSIDGRDHEDDPVPLADATDPAFIQFAGAFSAAIVAERDELKEERDRLAARLLELGDKPISTESITPRQAKLALYGAGLLDQVETMVAAADKAVQIHYQESVIWYRSDPVLNGLAVELGMSSEQLDELFASAARL
jgi:hypothetical protein